MSVGDLATGTTDTVINAADDLRSFRLGITNVTYDASEDVFVLA